MPSPAHQAYRNFLRSWCSKHAHEPHVANSLKLHANAALVLWHLDLGPALPILKQCYAPNPRGGRPWDPLVLLRCLLLALLVGKPKINAWVRELKANDVLCALCGIDPQQPRRPGVGTLYGFLHRLHDGPQRRCRCGHSTPPSELERRRARSPMPPKHKLQHHQPSPAAQRNVAQQLVQQLADADPNDSPNDLLQRLAQLLFQTAVVRSAQLGLLPCPDKLILCADGSPLRTAASKYGKRTCRCPPKARCNCPRIYSDPDAAIGYDPHRRCYFFGHHIYELTACCAGHDLPIFITLHPANETDFTASLKAIDRLRKLLRRCHPQMRIDTVVCDAGHDCEPFYSYALQHGFSIVAPLAKDAPATHPQRPELRLSSRGVPLCPAGCEMAPWGSAGSNRRLFVCPVKASYIPRCPLAPAHNPNWLCRPNEKLAPVVNLSVAQNPRLCPPVPRNSPTFHRLYNLRSGSERSFSYKKHHLQLEAARHRRYSFWLITLYLMAIVQHAKAWVAHYSATALLDELLGTAQQQAA